MFFFAIKDDSTATLLENASILDTDKDTSVIG